MSSTTPPLRIDIVSDIMCPWCVVGYRQLAQALAETQTEHRLHWLPFELNPDMPPEGQNMREHLMEKYGLSAEESDANRARITQAGAQLGFEFNFTSEMRMHNTFNAHQLLTWAGQIGQQNELKQALFSAHFTDHRPVSDPEVLISLTEQVGLDPKQARACLEDQRFAPSVRTLQNDLRAQGVQSVPAFIFNQKHLVSGAQGVENFTRILQQLAHVD